MAAPRRESTGSVGRPLRAFPVLAVAASIVAVAMHYNGFVPAGPPQPRVDPVGTELGHGVARRRIPANE